METIPKADCQNIGIIKKTHGVHGEVILEFESQYEESVENAQRFFVELDGLLVPFFVGNNGIRFKSAKSVIVRFDWVETENYAKRLVGNNVFLFHSDIVLTDTETFAADFNGYLLIDKNNGEIGEILKTDNYSGNMVFSVQYKKSEILVPFSEQLTLKINKKMKTITMLLPEGLL
jgi:16S rRNA processing protein RimM